MKIPLETYIADEVIDVLLEGVNPALYLEKDIITDYPAFDRDVKTLKTRIRTALKRFVAACE